LEGVWRQLNAKLEANAKAEFEDIVAERDVVPHLNELDRLVGDAKARKEQDDQSAEEQDHAVYVCCFYSLVLASALGYVSDDLAI
jgi:kinetochore protein NNF1